MKIYLVSMILFLAVLPGCSAVFEREAEVPVVSVEAKPAACSFPKAYDSQSNVLAGIDCLEMNLDNAFASLKGKIDDELSIHELRKLQEAGLLEFKVADESEWNGIAGLLSLIHPEGKDSISRNEIRRFLSWMKTRAGFFSKLAAIHKYKGHNATFDYATFREITEVIDEMLGFLSDKGTLSLDQAQALLNLAQGNAIKVETNKAPSYLSAIWRLKALLLESTRPDDRVIGSSLKTFLRLAVKVARQGEQSYQWWETGFLPNKIPANIEIEWQAMLDLVKDYFARTRTFDLATDEIKALVRVILPESELPDRIPDLVRASEMLLARRGVSRTGLIYGLLHLFEGADKVASDLRQAGQFFTGCDKAESCFTCTRHALLREPMKSLSLLSSRDWNGSTGLDTAFITNPRLPRRKDGYTYWNTILKRIAEKRVITNIFSAFDTDQNKEIPYQSSNPEDLKEATDIAYNIINIISTENRVGSDGKTLPLYIKPSTIVGAIGLLGDHWVMPGNRNGKLDADEFYALLKVYEDINTISNSSSLNLVAYAKDFAAAQRGFPTAKDTLYVDRKAFVKTFGTVYRAELPYLTPVFKHLDSSNGGAASLIDLIVPKHKDTRDAYQYGKPTQTVQLTDYFDRDDMIGPVAFLVLFDRLIIKCDTNEDERFSWKELDCVAPLALETAKQFFKSDLVEFPPFVADGVSLTADYLMKNGLPKALTKVALLNGSLSKVNLSTTFVRRAKSEIRANIGDLAALLSAMGEKSENELKKDISVAVIWANSYRRGIWARTMSGGDANAKDTVAGEDAWDSVISNLLIKGIFPSLIKKSDDLLNQETIEAIWEEFDQPEKSRYPRVAALKKLVEVSIVLGARPDDWQKLFNSTPGEDKRKMDPISPANVLSLLEGLMPSE